MPVCPEDAIDLLGYTDAQMRAAIDGLSCRRSRWHERRDGTACGTRARSSARRPLMHAPILAALADGPLTVPQIAERDRRTRPRRSCSG